MAIVIEDLKFSWNLNKKKPFININKLIISPGEKVFIKGPSGSGKTTLLGLLGGVLLPNAGKISLLGTETQKLTGSQRDKFRANHVGFVFQMFNLLPYLNVLDNVLLALKFSEVKSKKLRSKGIDAKDESVRLLKALGLKDPKLYQKPISSLSVGQQQRVAVARAMIGSPEIVIADEPTSALDTDARDRFIDLLLEECNRANTTLLFVSHDHTLSKHFDRGIEMKQITNHNK